MTKDEITLRAEALSMSSALLIAHRPRWVCSVPRALNTEQKSISHCHLIYDSDHLGGWRENGCRTKRKRSPHLFECYCNFSVIPMLRSRLHLLLILFLLTEFVTSGSPITSGFGNLSGSQTCDIHLFNHRPHNIIWENRKKLYNTFRKGPHAGKQHEGEI